jgi:hypothetical protein
MSIVEWASAFREAPGPYGSPPGNRFLKLPLYTKMLVSARIVLNDRNTTNSGHSNQRHFLQDKKPMADGPTRCVLES